MSGDTVIIEIEMKELSTYYQIAEIKKIEYDIISKLLNSEDEQMKSKATKLINKIMKFAFSRIVTEYPEETEIIDFKITQVG